MGWNDARASLVAPGWKIITETGPSGARTSDGSRVRIQRPENSGGIGTVRIQPGTLRAWFEERGFEVTQLSKSGNRFHRGEIEALLGVVDGELAEVILTFTLSRNSPDLWQDWKIFVESLCEDWNFNVHDRQRGFMVGGSEILRVLSETESWKEFEANFKWPPVSQTLSN